MRVVLDAEGRHGHPFAIDHEEVWVFDSKHRPFV